MQTKWLKPVWDYWSRMGYGELIPSIYRAFHPERGWVRYHKLTISEAWLRKHMVPDGYTAVELVPRGWDFRRSKYRPHVEFQIEELLKGGKRK